MIVRSLLTLLGFKGDTQKLNQYGGALKKILDIGKMVIVTTIGIASAALKMAGDMEQVQIAFETMLGSAEKANDLIQEITEFAAKTPFELTGLVKSSKQLLAFGFAAEEIIPTMTTLGNVAAGVGKDKLPTIVRSLGKIRTKGKASMEELNMMLEAGVPILDELSKQLGVSTEELFKMISAGKVGFNDVNNALNSMGTGTGRFGGLMEKQSRSFLGILSNIGDWFTNFMIAIGKDLLPIGKELGKAFLDFLDANKDLMKSGLVQFIKGVIFGIVFVIRFVQRLIDRFGGMGKAMGGVQKILKSIGGFGLKVLKGIGAVIFSIADFVNMVVEAFGGWDVVLGAVGTGFDFLGDAIKWVLDLLSWLIRLAGKVYVFFINLGKWLADLGGKGFNKLGEGIQDTINFFLSIVRLMIKLWNGFTKWWTDLWKKVGETVLNIWDTIVEGIQNAWKNVVDFVTGLWEELMKFIGGVVDFGKGIADFFGGVFGGGPEANTSGRAADNAGTGGNNFNIKSSVNLGGVPPGTPEEQAIYIQEKARDAVKKEWNSIMNEGLTNLPQGVL